MTARRLRTRVGFVDAGLGILLGAAIVFKATGHDEVYTTIKELSPLVIAILAAYLASRFRRGPPSTPRSGTSGAT